MSEQGNMVIQATGISRGFRQGPKRVQVLSDVSLQVPAGTSMAIVGASGAGKSTLLHILGGLDRPDEGEVLVDGQSLWQKSDTQRSDLRNSRLVVAATPHRETNQQISEDANALSLPVNVVDSPDLCTFIFPSIVDRSPPGARRRSCAGSAT